MRLQAAPIFNSGFDGEALLDLADINKIGEICGEAEIAEHGFSNAGIAARVLLVAFHHLAGDVQVFFAGGEFFDDMQRRIRLETKFGTKTWIDITVMLKIFAFVPD